MKKILPPLAALALAAAAQAGGYAFAFDAIADDVTGHSELHLGTAELPPAPGGNFGYYDGNPATGIQGRVAYDAAAGLMELSGSLAGDVPESAQADHASIAASLYWTETIRLTATEAAPDGTVVDVERDLVSLRPASEPSGPTTTQLIVGQDYLLSYGVSFSAEVYNNATGGFAQIILQRSEYDPVLGDYVQILPLFVDRAFYGKVGLQSESGWVLRPTPVPEPASLAALALGAAGVAMRRRKEG